MTAAPPDFAGALSAYAAGVTLVTIADGRDDIGTTVSAFCPVSLEPPLVLVSLLATSYPAELLGTGRGDEAGPARVEPDNQAVVRTASRTGESCVAVSPARLERATCCSGNSRAFLLRHGDIRPPHAAAAGHACQGRDSNPQ